MVLKNMKMKWVAMKGEVKKGRMKCAGFLMIISVTVFSLFTLLLLATYTVKQHSNFDNGVSDLQFLHPSSSFTIFAWKPIFRTSDLPSNVSFSSL